VFKIIIIMFKCLPCIKWRVYVNALDLPSVLLFQGFEGEQVIAVYEDIVGIGVAVAVFGFEQEQAGFQAGLFAFS
jgi:hypothetical protein